MDWIEISVQADGEAGEAVSELFNRLNGRPDGQGGAVTEVTGFDPVGDEHRPVVLVRTYLPADAAETRDRQRRIEEGLWFLGRLYPLGEPQTRRLAEEDWANAWKAHYEPLRIGRHFLVVPAWMWPDGKPAASTPPAEGQPGWPADVERHADDLPLILDPGMAFGTGLHPSTQLCLLAMEDVVQPGCRVLDAGCGSGILSIGAVRLGASEVQAFDVDPIAVEATTQNARLNQLDVPVQVFVSSGPANGTFDGVQGGTAARFDVILVNILLPIILDLLERDLVTYLAPGGQMILAGVIADQESQLLAALDDYKLTVVRRLAQGDWISTVVARVGARPGARVGARAGARAG